MKRYEKYKPTGIQWLPEIPEHWNIMQLRKYLSLVSIKGKGNKQLLSVTREKGVIERDIFNLEENHNFVPEDLNGYKYVTPGQFVINKMKSWQGSYGVSDYEGIVSPAYFVCDLNFPNKEFFSQAIRSRTYVDFFAQWSKGIRVGQWDLEPIALKSIPFFEPPISEQNKIVAYLDKRITLIDNCKCQRERELQTLNELKQAEIASVVTRGLNPDVPMKDSGIPWIGQIPKHWELRRFKTVCSLIREPSKKGDKKIGLENIESNTGRLIATDSVFDGEGVHFEPGDILFGKLRPYLAKVYLAKESAQAVGDFYVFRSNGSIIPAYLHKLIISAPFIGVVNAGTYGTKMPRASWQDISQLNIPLPPIEEQNFLVEYIESKTNKIDTMVEALKAEIDRLTEYKQRLISDVVTGQIDVRGEQI